MWSNLLLLYYYYNYYYYYYALRRSIPFSLRSSGARSSAVLFAAARALEARSRGREGFQEVVTITSARVKPSVSLPARHAFALARGAAAAE